MFGIVYWFLMSYALPTRITHAIDYVADFIIEESWRKYLSSATPFVGTMRVLHIIAIFEDCEGELTDACILSNKSVLLRLNVGPFNKLNLNQVREREARAKALRCLPRGRRRVPNTSGQFNYHSLLLAVRK